MIYIFSLISHCVWMSQIWSPKKGNAYSWPSYAAMRIYAEMETFYNTNQNDFTGLFIMTQYAKDFNYNSQSSIIWLKELQGKLEDCFVNIGKCRATF